MSTSNQQSQYTFQVIATVTATGNYDKAVWTSYSQNGMTDSLANSILQALNGVAMPAGMTMQATVTKNDVTTVTYVTGYANPITFT